MESAIVSIVFGLISLTIALIISGSQIFAVFKTRNTSGTSILSYVFLTICASICLCWGMLFYFSRMSDWFDPKAGPLLLNQWAVLPILLVYVFDIAAGIWIIILKNNHIRLAKKLKMTELQLSTYLLKQQQQKLAKSGKIYYRKYFGFVILIICFVIFLTIFGSCLLIFTNPYFVPHIKDISPDENKMNPVIISFSVIGAILWEAISWPQFIKCLKTKDTSGISLNWAIFLPISCIFSLGYSLALGFSSHEWWKVIGALIFNGIIVNVGILIIKLRNRRLAREHHVTEIEYTQKYLSKKQKRA